jgi:hypothetical protein
MSGHVEVNNASTIMDKNSKDEQNLKRDSIKRTSALPRGYRQMLRFADSSVANEQSG